MLFHCAVPGRRSGALLAAFLPLFASSYLAAAQPSPYVYKVVAKVGDTIAGKTLIKIGDVYAVNNAGTVIFWGQWGANCCYGLFTQDRLLAEWNQSIDGTHTITGFDQSAGLNNDGTSVFAATSDGGNYLLSNDGTGLRVLAKWGDPVDSGHANDKLNWYILGPSINTYGDVAFYCDSVYAGGICVKDASGIRIVIRNGDDLPDGTDCSAVPLVKCNRYLGFSRPSINRFGAVAFIGSYRDFVVGGSYYGATVSTQSEILARSGSTIAGTTLFSFGVGNASKTPWNDAVTAVFVGSYTDPRYAGLSYGLFTQNTAVHKRGDPVAGYTLDNTTYDPVLSNNGTIVFRAPILPTGEGIFTPDHPVFVYGNDYVAGLPVIVGNYVINDNGVLAMKVYYGNPITYSAIVLAYPNPATTTAARNVVVSYGTQTISVNASVKSTVHDVAVDRGTVTFAVPGLSHTAQVPVVAGQANTTLTIPANTAAGVYPISADYHDSDSVYQDSHDFAGKLTVNPGAPAAGLSYTLARNGADVLVNLTIASKGTAPLQNLALTAARIGTKPANPPLPSYANTATWTTVPVGETRSTTLTFPSVAAGASTLTLTGAYTGGSFNSVVRVTVP